MLTFSRRFGSEVFTLYAGPGKQQFTAHSEILFKSPVLKRMCNGPFLENQTKVINLPDDDADIIELMLECLYSSHNAHSDLNFVKVICHEAGISFLKQLAELYIVADKYQLSGIQTVIVDTLADKQIHFTNVTMFLMITGRIYENIATSNGPFPRWFRNVVKRSLERASPNQLKAFRDLVRGGDDLAADIFTAMAQAQRAPVDIDNA